jgi:hypothetical protein
LLLGDYRNATDEERDAQSQRFLVELHARSEAEANPVYKGLKAKTTALTLALVLLALALLILESTNATLRQRLQCYEASNKAFQVQKCLDRLS